jgi:hypothetical protein
MELDGTPIDWHLRVFEPASFIEREAGSVLRKEALFASSQC